LILKSLTMIAILSCTPDDLYLFNLPFAIHSWNKIGVRCIVFVPMIYDEEHNKRIVPLFRMKMYKTLAFEWYGFEAPADKQATYAQCSRLYAGAIPGIDPLEIMITADADMCVFQKEYWKQFVPNGAINIVGHDLVPAGQFPMCYIAMPAVGWRDVFHGHDRTYQQCLDDLLGGIEADNFRGNYWAKDQEEAHNRISAGPYPIVRHFRAAPGTQFATRRADRDGWVVTEDIIDAHLPRPGYTDENFAKILHLFKFMYPNDDHLWMHKYREEYVKLL
jgi:hypothetical protein